MKLPPADRFGPVIRYFPEKGFGFIEGVEGEDVFFHVCDIKFRPPTIQVGAQFMYALVPGKKPGQVAAKNITWMNNGDREEMKGLDDPMAEPIEFDEQDGIDRYYDRLERESEY